MKKSLSILIIVFFSTLIFFSCSKSPEKKVAGTWKVEDVKFESDKQIPEAQIASSKESAKAVSYELLEDKTAKVHVGSTVLEGFWEYRKEEEGVYMSFKGSFDTVLLGKLVQDKLINEASRPNIKITTIFAKEK